MPLQKKPLKVRWYIIGRILVYSISVILRNKPFARPGQLSMVYENMVSIIGIEYASSSKSSLLISSIDKLVSAIPVIVPYSNDSWEKRPEQSSFTAYIPILLANFNPCCRLDAKRGHGTVNAKTVGVMRIKLFKNFFVIARHYTLILNSNRIDNTSCVILFTVI